MQRDASSVLTDPRQTNDVRRGKSVRINLAMLVFAALP